MCAPTIHPLTPAQLADLHTRFLILLPRIERHGRIGRSVVDAVIVSALLYKKSGAATQSRNAPIPSSWKEQARDQRASVNDKSDRIARRRAGHRRIDTRSIVSGKAAGVLVAPVSQVAI